jgi:hypothetical protein
MRNVTSFVLKATAAATLSIAAVATTTATAQAQQLNLVGSVNLNDQPGNPANLFVDFVNNFVLATPSITGVFTPEIVPFNTTGTINDVVVGPGGLVAVTGTPFIAIGGYSFSLTSTPLATGGGLTYGPIRISQEQNGVSASLSVNGTVTGGDFGSAMVPYIGLFTTQFTSQEFATPEALFNFINTGGRDHGQELLGHAAGGAGAVDVHAARHRPRRTRPGRPPAPYERLSRVRRWPCTPRSTLPRRVAP